MFHLIQLTGSRCGEQTGQERETQSRTKGSLMIRGQTSGVRWKAVGVPRRIPVRRAHVIPSPRSEWCVLKQQATAPNTIALYHCIKGTSKS